LATDGKPDPAAQVSAGCHLRSAHRFGGRGHRVLADCWVRPPVDMRGAMAPVYVATRPAATPTASRGFISTGGMAP